MWSFEEPAAVTTVTCFGFSFRGSPTTPGGVAATRRWGRGRTARRRDGGCHGKSCKRSRESRCQLFDGLLLLLCFGLIVLIACAQLPYQTIVIILCRPLE